MALYGFSPKNISADTDTFKHSYFNTDNIGNTDNTYNIFGDIRSVCVIAWIKTCFINVVS